MEPRRVEYSVVTSEEPVDYRFLLANDRTLLAYVRTALALQIAGLGVMQFLTQGHEAIRLTLGSVIVLMGSSLGAAGYHRWLSNDRTIRANAEMQATRSLPLVVAGVVVVPIIAVVVLVVA